MPASTKRLHSKKEFALYQELQTVGVQFEYQCRIPFRGCGLKSETTGAYVDFVIPKPWGYILLECEEDQHRSYDPSCDVRRDFDMAASVALGSAHKLMVVRYNPDSYRIDGKTRVESKNDRINRLLVLLDYGPVAFERVLLCYDQDSTSTLPQVGVAWEEAARQVSRIA